MADQELFEAFNDCIDRLAAGQSVADCLRRYPQYAETLEPMLEVGSLISRSQAESSEVLAARLRVRQRVNRHMVAPARHRSYAGLIAVAASFIIATTAVFAAAEGSLPGDMLYNVKRFTEDARAMVIGEQFAGRRIDEIRQLVALKRAEEVSFSGDVRQIAPTGWNIGGLKVQVSDGTPGANAAVVGDRVQVTAHTTNQGELVAETVTLIGKELLLTATPTLAPTTAPTTTPTPTFIPTTAPTVTTIPTVIPTAAPTLAVPQITVVTPEVCAPQMPAGWMRYTVGSGDTVVGLAAYTGITVDELMRVNCLPESRMIVVGQTLYLPVMPATITPTGPAPTSSPVVNPPNSAPTSDHQGSSSGSEDNGDSGDSGAS